MKKLLGVVAAVILVMMSLGAAKFPEGSDFGERVTKGDIALDAQPATGVNRFVASAGALSSIEGISSASVDQGGVLTVDVLDVLEYSCSDTVFVVEAYAPEPPSDGNYEARTLDHLTQYDPIAGGTLVTARTDLIIPANAEPGEWTLVAYTFCYDSDRQEIIGGTDAVAFKTFFVQEVEDSTRTSNPDTTTDSDGDGLKDAIDACPNEASDTSSGCRDGDGRDLFGAVFIGLGLLLVLGAVVWWYV